MDILEKLKVLLGKVEEIADEINDLVDEIEELEIDEIDELDDEDEDEEDDIKIGLSEQSKSPDELGTFFLSHVDTPIGVVMGGARAACKRLQKLYNCFY